ncbi:hypothetical protein MSAN_00629400 [Mycena sanguinolenta]|uniref:Uncharacterized protein n=1 Tax=Mycena sanguinolenta TaxID=230812 RepID=A0A8H6Z668_9AGAR|nr:hypothetical protein MSAN_00629400 [Mycena sanguinolenta]
MLLILLAIHLLSRDSIAAPLPRPPDARATTDSCDDINNCRTFFDIVWGCLATIFACTWVSVHPNVPPTQAELASAVLAKAENDAHRNDRPGSHVEYKFSSMQAFFFCMGGFVSLTGHPIATKEQLGHPITSKEQLGDGDLGSELQEAIRNVDDKEIADRSKGDALSKGVALLQGSWFILQCLARVHQHLAVTQLEVATLAFAVVNIFIWLLWWNKPLDVQRPIVIGPPTQPDTETITPVQLPRFTRFLGVIWGYSEAEYKPLSSISVSSFWSVYNEGVDGGDVLLSLVGTLFGAIHCAAWNTIFPTPAEMWIWRTSSLGIIAIPGLAFLLSLSISSDRLDWVSGVIGVILILATPIYIAARIILLVLPLAELRFLPASAFVDVNWSTYIPPHITSSFNRYMY